VTDEVVFDMLQRATSASRSLAAFDEYVPRRRTQHRGGHWGVLNTAILQKNSANTAIPQKNSLNTAIPQYRLETRCYTKTTTLYVNV